MTALQAASLPETPQLEEHAGRRLSFTMTALSFVNPWRSSSRDQLTVKDPPTYDIYTLDQVSYHDHSNDCWIVLYDRVYDITSFLKEHPGGADVLLEYAGRDATLAFRGAGHTAQTANLLRPFIVGQLPPHETIYRKVGGFKLSGIPD